MREIRFILALSLGLLLVVVVCGHALGEVRQRVDVSAKVASGSGFDVLLQRLAKHHPLLLSGYQKLAGLRRVAKVSGAWPNVQINYQREQLFPAVGQDTVGLQVRLPLGGRTFRKKDVAKMLVKLHNSYLSFLFFRVRLQYLRMYFRWQRMRRSIVLSQKLLAQFRRLRVVLAARVSGGRIAAMELTRFDLEVEQQRHKIRRNQEQTLVLMRRLARWVGVSEKRITSYRVALVPPAKSNGVRKGRVVLTHPYLRYLRAQYAVNQARLRLAHARAWPDLSLSLAYLRQEPSTPGQLDGHGFVLGVSIPLPFSQRNQAAIQRRHMNLQLTKRQLNYKQQQLQRRATYARQRLRQGYARLQRFRVKTLRRLPGLLKASQIAFREGTTFSTFLSTYRSIEQYQQFGLTLQHDVRVRALDLQESLGHVSIP